MKISINVALLLCFSLIITSCANFNQNTKNTQSIQMTIKTNQIKINDTGFLYDGKFYKVVEVFKLTKKILTIKTNDNQICINNDCYAKKDFNKHFFGTYYYENLLDDIFAFQPIFGKSQYQQKNDECFNQEIQDKVKDISYLVCKNNLHFKDKKHNTLIKIKIFNN